jgi:GNAT superfamily N-acetyltransferase
LSTFKIKIAEEEDLPLVMEMAMKFAENSNYLHLISRDKIESFVLGLIRSPKEKAVIFLCEDKGMLAAYVSEFLLGNIVQATELAWWVSPKYRKSHVGKTLMEAFDYWAEKIGAKIKVMSSLDNSVAKYYEKNGYKLYERVYFKEI